MSVASTRRQRIELLPSKQELMPRQVGAPPLDEKGLLAAGESGQSVVVAHLPSKERARVRFPLAAPATLLLAPH